MGELSRLLRTNDYGVCFNTLCALEGALQEKRWHYLHNKDKEELKRFFESLG